MKQTLFTIISLLVISCAVQGQHFNIGIKGGLNAYTIMGDNSSGYEPIPSYHFGLLGHMHQDSRIAFQPEVVYSAQGIQDKNNSNSQLNLNYVNIPLLLQYMYDNGFRIQAGPQFGILTSAKSGSTDVKSSYKNYDVGFSVGVSYVKPSTGFGYDIRYNHGFTNINESDAINSYNRGIQVGLFYLFQHRN